MEHPETNRCSHLTQRVVVFTALLLAMTGCDGEQKKPVGETGRVQRGEFVVVVREEGKVEAAESFTIMSNRRGEIEWMIDEGERVKKGDDVVRQKIDNLVEDLDSLETEYAEVKEQLQEQLQNRKVEKRQVELDVESARIQMELQELKRSDIHQQPLPRDLELARRDFEKSEVANSARKREHEQAKALFTKGVVTEKERADKQLNFKLAQANFVKARTTFKDIKDGSTDLEKRRADLDAESARIDWKIATTTAKSRLAELDLKERNLRRRIRNIENRLKWYKEEITLRQLKAPADGLVVYRSHYHHGSGKFKVGDRVWPRLGIIDLPDLSHVKVKTQISERYVGQMKKDMPVSITLPSLDGRKFPGRVSRVDAWAHDKNENLDVAAQKKLGLSGTKVFDVEIIVDADNTDEQIKLGFKAEVEFPLKSVSDAVYVDKRAVYLDQEKHMVHTVNRGPVAVKLGRANDTHVIIASGLDAGQEVRLRP